MTGELADVFESRAQGVAAITATTGSNIPTTTTQKRQSNPFTIGKLAARRGGSLRGARRLTSLLSKPVDPHGIGGSGRDTSDVPTWTAKVAEAFRSIERAASRTFRHKITSTPFPEKNGGMPFNASGVVSIGPHRFIFIGECYRRGLVLGREEPEHLRRRRGGRRGDGRRDGTRFDVAVE